MTTTHLSPPLGKGEETETKKPLVHHQRLSHLYGSKGET